MANAKISALDELITPAAADLLPIVDDPAGTPITKKVTVANLLAAGGGILASLLDAKGDLIAASAADTAARLAAAANGASLITDSGAATGLRWRLNNDAANAAPTVTDDSAAGYSVGSRWIDVTNGLEYVCVNASVGAAVWLATVAGLDSFIGPIDPSLGTTTSNIQTAEQVVGSSFVVRRRVTVSEAWFHVSVQSGNIDIGIVSGSYADGTLTRVARTGVIACPAGGSPAASALAAPVTLIPGVRYWSAVWMDNTSATLRSTSSVVATTLNTSATEAFYRTAATSATGIPASLAVDPAVTSFLRGHQVYYR